MTRPPTESVLFIDDCLGSDDVFRRLVELGRRVERYRDHFGPATPDSFWIPQVAAKGWVILSKDKQIRRRAVERSAVMAHGAVMFTLAFGNSSAPEDAKAIELALKDIDKLVSKALPPLIATISRQGRVTPITSIMRKAAVKRTRPSSESESIGIDDPPDSAG